MADIDPELIDRAIRWCAEAGRQTTPAAVRAALGPLSWDQLLAVRALLADAPPIRPLGPFALADISRGAPADVAAEHERAGRYGGAEAEAASSARVPSPVSSPPRARARKNARAPFVVKRASARAEPGAPAPRVLPLLDELLLDEGRAILERLVRLHGGRRARLVAALAAGWRRADGAPLDGADLDRVLSQHGMARSFEIRERDELLHALRAAGGVRARAAEALGLDRAALDDALERLGASGDAEKIRELRRREIRSRGTLTQRTHLLLDETERLADLGLLEEFSRDLASRLPDHVRALTASSAAPAAELLARSLTLDAQGVERLLQHTGLRLADLPASAPRPTAPSDRRPAGHGPRRERSSPRPAEARSPAAGRAAAGGRPGGRPAERAGARPGGRPSGRPGERRPGGRPGGRSGPRPGGGSRPPKRR